MAGIDLGTSSVKVLLTENGKNVFKVKKSYANDLYGGYEKDFVYAFGGDGSFLIL